MFQITGTRASAIGYPGFHFIRQSAENGYERWIGFSARRWQLIRRRRKYQAAKPQ